jgi:hypothetical protein
MESYTFGSDNFMEAIALERMRMQENYPITLNDKDFRIVTEILRGLALYGEVDRHKLNDLVGWRYGGNLDQDPIEEWAWNALSGIGVTLEVEGI